MMDVNAPEWDGYMARFEALQTLATPYQGKAKPVLDTCRFYLCLFGDNGFPTPEEELSYLETLEQYCQNHPDTHTLFALTVSVGYWEDVILFVPTV
ncbi:MAG: hypothetical protein ACKO37_10255 [Vampirovibrionales bacterium]